MNKNESIASSINTATIRNVESIPPQQSLTFASSGEHLIYSDNKEDFTVSNTSKNYLWEFGVGTSYKDVEMYHLLYNGNDHSPLRVGIAVQNTNASGTSATITYKCATANLNSAGDGLALTVTPNALRTFLNASYQTKTISGQTSAFLCGYSGSFASGCPKFAFVRARIKASVSSGIYLRAFAIGSDNYNNVGSIFSISTVDPGQVGHFCGELPYNQKTVSVDASINKSYHLFGSTTNNTNEYDTAYTTPKSPGQTQLIGNYGVRYTFNITNASGKVINIFPDWAIGNRTSASLLYKLNSGAWTVGSIITSNMMWSLSLGTSSTATFSMYLAGGNCGNYIVYFS